MTRPARAPNKGGDRAAAKSNYQKIIALVGKPDSDRPEVKAAYQALGRS